MRFLPVVLILSAAVGSYFAASLAADRVERVTLEGVDAALAAEGHDWASATVDGLSVQLRGEARDEATRFAALTAAGTVVDASRIVDQMQVMDAPDIAPPAFSVEVLRNDDGVSLIGLIPATSDSGEIAEAARRLSNGAPVADLLESADHPVPPTWETALNFGLEMLDDLPRAKVSITADRVAVSAVTASPEEKQDVEARLTRAKPDEVRLVLDISAPRPVITPFTLRFVSDDDGARFDACSAETVSARDRILAAATAAGAATGAACPLGLGAPSSRWAEAAETAIATIATLGGGTLTFSNADITLIAPEGTSSSDFDRAIGELENDLPPVFSLTAILPEPEEADDGTGDTPEFVATRSPEGVVQLRGRLADERSKAAVTSFAAARFGATDIVPATRLDEDLPAGWSVRVLAGLEALSQLDNGAVLVDEATVDISGVTGNQGASAEIARVLSDMLGEGATFAIDVTYSEALDPTAGLPTPEECVANINALLDANKITFAPSSSDIEDSAGDTIDAIAEIVRDCPDVPMEIAGHTDSQGRETMNQQLSQARANAVLNAIMGRRVLTSNIVAQGYGESDPIADNGTAEGREANRRITFTLIETDTAEAESAGSDDADGAAESDADETTEDTE